MHLPNVLMQKIIMIRNLFIFEHFTFSFHKYYTMLLTCGIIEFSHAHTLHDAVRLQSSICIKLSGLFM